MSQQKQLSEESKRCLECLVNCIEVLDALLDRDGLSEQLPSLVQQAVTHATDYENHLYRIVRTDK